MLCHRLVVGSGGASATAVDVATGAAVMATTTMPSTLSSLRPQPRTKTRTSASRWHSKALALAHSRTVPVNPPQPPRCCHRAEPSCCAPRPLRFGCAADAATPDRRAAHHRRASPAAASTLLQSLCRCRAVHCHHSLRRHHRRSAAKLWRPFPSLVRLIVNMQAQCVGCLNFW